MVKEKLPPNHPHPPLNKLPNLPKKFDYYLIKVFIKGKLRSRNILLHMKAHIPSVLKIVVIWCSTDLNFSSGSLKSLKNATFEHQRPPS